MEGSRVYEDAVFLQGVLDNKLAELATLHHVPGVDLQQCEAVVTRARSGIDLDIEADERELFLHPDNVI